jgi:hypothetical protein
VSVKDSGRRPTHALTAALMALLGLQSWRIAALVHSDLSLALAGGWFLLSFLHVWQALQNVLHRERVNQ